MKINKGAVVKGGTSLDYKTGNWRDTRPILNQKLCKKCDICKDVCPDDAVRVEAEVYAVDYTYCKGCGICAFECPADAIDMVPEEK